ncbi:MAG: HlyD family type I secretion periplasmic adaptor subunit [Kordiimonadaceae bacterium]|jgi:membrane fusion protein, adhesin transport system|nr:HlyD family type I secretion periplasmic adaptor subunit [Kordiimonadaceae bacterium]MBT6033700.1 HlyD family type I secretion periplasmic adaptor subunit [Kordiimonadaceae bacterium]
MTEDNKNSSDENLENSKTENSEEESNAVEKSEGNLVQRQVGSILRKNKNDTQYYARFLSRSTLLEEAGPPKSSITTIGIISTFVLGFFVWAFFSTLNETSVAMGEVVPAISVQPVQHLEGGIVSGVLVKDGDTIKKGQPLIQLDTTSTLSELNRTRARYVSLDMQMRRLRDFALREDADFSDYEDEYPVIALDQEKILNQQKQSRAAQENVYISKIASSRNQLSVLEQQEASRKEATEIVAEELKIREELTEKGLGSKIRLLEIQRDYVTVKGEYDSAVEQKIGVRAGINEAEGNLVQLRERLNGQALEQLGQMVEESVQLQSELKRLNDKLSRLSIKSPVDGIVKGLKYRAIAAVIPPGDLIAEIVPNADNLIAEVRISPRDVGHVIIGSEVNLKVDTYNYSLYGGVPSILSQVSASSYLDEEGNAYFRGYIELPQNYVGADPAANRITPGMTLIADIKTGEKTLLEYLTRPINNALDTAFRER